MALALDSSGTPASQTTSFSFTHTPVGTVRAVIITVNQQTGFNDEVTSVTYGGVPCNRVAINAKSTGETGAVYVYFLGANIPTGAQTVAINVNATGSPKRPTVWALTAASDTSVKVIDTSIISDSQANPSTTLALGGTTCWCAIEFLSGQDSTASIAPLANWTATLTQQWGVVQCGGSYRYNTISNVDVTAGWTQTADDTLAIAFAVQEGIPAGTTTTLASQYRINN